MLPTYIFNIVNDQKSKMMCLSAISKFALREKAQGLRCFCFFSPFDLVELV